MSLATVEPDISHYIESKLIEIGEFYNLNPEWASKTDIQALTKKAFGLFIFAATSVKFILDQSYCSPKDQLKWILQGTADTDLSTSPNKYLDQLYLQVLACAFPDVKQSLAACVTHILGTIVLLQDPLSTAAIEHLLNLEPYSVRQTLGHLHSTILVPENETQPVLLLHPSFTDFLTNSTRCNNPTFAIDSTMQHTHLACACLYSMQKLKKDICKIGNYSILNSEVSDLPAQILKCIPSYLQYACRHWVWHFTHSVVTNDLLNLIQEFCAKYLLYWIEVCSLVGELRNALLALDSIKGFLVVSNFCCQ
jgi:hypothetical protein